MALSLMALLLATGTARDARQDVGGLSLAESLACLGLVALPAPGYLMARTMGLELTERYLLPAVIGAAALITCGLWKAAKGRAASAALFVLILGGWFAGRHGVDMRGLTRPGPLEVQLGTTPDPLPVVIASPLIFLEYVHYATSEVASHMVYVADPELALRYVGTDSLDRDLQLAQPYFSLPLITWNQLRRDNPRFYLLVHPGPFVWLPDRIEAEGVEMTLVSAGGGVSTFEVEWNSDQPSEAERY